MKRRREKEESDRDNVTPTVCHQEKALCMSHELPMFCCFYGRCFSKVGKRKKARQASLRDGWDFPPLPSFALPSSVGGWEKLQCGKSAQVGGGSPSSEHAHAFGRKGVGCGQRGGVPSLFPLLPATAGGRIRIERKRLVMGPSQGMVGGSVLVGHSVNPGCKMPNIWHPP